MFCQVFQFSSVLIKFLVTVSREICDRAGHGNAPSPRRTQLPLSEWWSSTVAGSLCSPTQTTTPTKKIASISDARIIRAEQKACSPLITRTYFRFLQVFVWLSFRSGPVLFLRIVARHGAEGQPARRQFLSPSRRC